MPVFILRPIYVDAISSSDHRICGASGLTSPGLAQTGGSPTLEGPEDGEFFFDVGGDGEN